MKYIMLYIVFLSLLSSCSNSVYDKTFIHHDFRKDRDLELTLRSDSTFVLIDRYGCNRMSQTGRWYKSAEDIAFFENSFVLYDTTQVENVHLGIHKGQGYSYTSNYNGKRYLIRKDFYFPLIDRDTLFLIEKNRLNLNGVVFELSDKNVNKEKILSNEADIIYHIGKRQYIRVYGEGESL